MNFGPSETDLQAVEPATQPTHVVNLSNLIQRVVTFNYSVVKIGERTHGQMLSAPEADWLKTALKEEADELKDATTLVDQVDACGDAIIFAIGGMARMGLTPLDIDRVLHAIMDANFEKKAGVKPGREGAPDAVKPEGWVGPEERIKVILNV
jgi:predicted HAD superfamily Cof-like phosphohydrolase